MATSHLNNDLRRYRELSWLVYHPRLPNQTNGKKERSGGWYVQLIVGSRATKSWECFERGSPVSSDASLPFLFGVPRPAPATRGARKGLTVEQKGWGGFKGTCEEKFDSCNAYSLQFGFVKEGECGGPEVDAGVASSAIDGETFE